MFWQEFYKNVIAKADIIQATGDAIAVFSEVQCLTPRYTNLSPFMPNFVQGSCFYKKVWWVNWLSNENCPHTLKYNAMHGRPTICFRTSSLTHVKFSAFVFRGRYDIKLYPKFLQLHGKTFNYNIPYTTILRLFLLPHKDGRQMFFMVSSSPIFASPSFCLSVRLWLDEN